MGSDLRNFHNFYIEKTRKIDIPSYQRNLEIAEECELMIPIFGIHPWNAPKYVERFDQLEYLVDQTPMIGEGGLDYHFIEDKSCFPDQKIVAFVPGFSVPKQRLERAKQMPKEVYAKPSQSRKVVEETGKRLGKLAEVIHYPIDHFDIYTGNNFEKSVSDQLDFFKKHLL